MSETSPPSRRPSRDVVGYYSAPRRRCAPWSWVIGVVLFAVLLRLGVGLARPVTIESLRQLPDQDEYFELAKSIRYAAWLAERRGAMALALNFSFYDDTSNAHTYAGRMPLYPVFIALCGCKPHLVQGVQAILDGSTVVAAAVLGWRFGSRLTGVLAGLLVAVHPYLIYFSTLLLSETLFTCMLVWSVVLLSSGRFAARVLGCLLLTGSVYARPSVAVLAVLWTAWVVYRRLAYGRSAAHGDAPIGAVPGIGAEAGRSLRAVVAVAVGVAVLVIALLPWSLRNQRMLGQRVWLTTNDGLTAYDSFNPGADGSSNQAAIRAALRPREDLREVGRSDLLKRMAYDYAASHPARVVTLAFAKLGRFWSPVPLSADFGGRWLYVVVGGLYAVPLFVFAAIGVWRGGLGRRATLVLLLPAIYFSAVHSLAVGSLRYRVPCDVPLAVLAAAGVASFVKPKAAPLNAPEPAA